MASALTGKKAQQASSKDKAGTERSSPAHPSDHEEIDDRQLARLAQKRADQARTYLIQQGKIPAQRIAFKPVQINSTPDGNPVQVELFLSVQ